MSDISRRDVLKAGAVSGIAGIGVGGVGTVSAQPGDDIIDDLLGNNGNSGSSTECAATVSPSGTGTHSTIQAAIDDVSGSPNADPKDASTFTIICIEAGVYEENLTVDKPGIALASTGSGDGTVITARGTVVDSVAEWSVLFDLTINADSGPAVDGGPRTVVQRSTIRTSDTVGIDATSHIFAIGNDFFDAGTTLQEGTGIRATGVRGDSNSNNYNGTFISGNTFHINTNADGSNYSFDTYREPVRITDCTEVGIKGNTFKLAGYAAVYVESTGTTDPTSGIWVNGNTFNQNANGIIFFENPSGGRITECQVNGNKFENFVYGVLTSHEKVPFDYDNDGETEQVEAPGALRGGKVEAQCNWWDDPRGPNTGDNEQQSISPVPNWAIPRQLNSVKPGPDKVVAEGVIYRPWAIQSHDPGNKDICIGGEGTDVL